ncbi:DUF4097 family beta strand repeat-containing protein [Halomicrococcus gelatinilyticus]|uniref:DUF4097 family beta strand repeat-containing protein n=1 Tax=Halomicrococcus gelatinilyticus TaxID=1702103 RepID=UPI002E12A1CE
MTVDRTRRRLLALGGTAAIASLSGCTNATPFVGKRLESTDSYDVASDDQVTVDTNGDVTVRPTDRDRVRVKTVKQSSSVFADVSKVTVNVSRDDGTLRIATRGESGGSWLEGSTTVDVTVDLPAGVALDTVRTVNGDVDVRRVAGDATLETVNGDVSVRSLDGFFSAETTNGDVEARDVAGVESVTTTNGEVAVDVPAVRDAAAVETTNGDIAVAVSPDLNAELAATTDFGDVAVRGLSLDDSMRTEHLVEGELGDGEGRLRIASTNGDLSVSKLD